MVHATAPHTALTTVLMMVHTTASATVLLTVLMMAHTTAPAAVLTRVRTMPNMIAWKMASVTALITSLTTHELDNNINDEMKLYEI